jgi:hypothetical protein
MQEKKFYGQPKVGRRRPKFKKLCSAVTAALIGYFSAGPSSVPSIKSYVGVREVMAEPLLGMRLSQEQLEAKAVEAVKLLKNFMLNGKPQVTKFLELWNKFINETHFEKKFVSELASLFKTNSTIRSLTNSYFRAKKIKLKDVKLEDIKKMAKAFAECYDYLKQAPRHMSRDQLKKEFGPFFNEFLKFKGYVTVPVRIPAQLDNKSINHFLKTFSVAIKPGASKKQKIRALAKKVSTRYKITDPELAVRLSRALIIAYVATSTVERKSFDQWVSTLDAKKMGPLAKQVKSIAATRALQLSYTAVHSAFKSWRSKKIKNIEALAKEEAKLTRYPRFIRQGNLAAMSRDFQSSPRHYALTKIATRLEYLRKKRRIRDSRGKKADVKEIDKEIKKLQTWLKKIGIEEKTPEMGISLLDAGLRMIQSKYHNASDQNLKVADFLLSASFNPALARIYNGFLSGLDKRVARLFIGIKPSARDYATRIKKRISSRITLTKIKRAQAQWYNDYYKSRAPKRKDLEQTPAEAQVFLTISNLSPLAAAAFSNYLKKVSSGRLSSDVEKKLVVGSVADLAKLHPQLIVRYFSAISNLAYICENHPQIFREAITVLAARIKAASAVVGETISPGQMLSVRNTINRLESAFTSILELDKASIAHFDRIELMDDSVLIRKYPPHSIEQKPRGYSPRLLLDREKGRTYFPTHPFPQYLGVPVQRTIFTTGSVHTSPITYGGKITLSSFKPFRVSSGASLVGAAFENYLNPQHPFVPISRNLPGVSIGPPSLTKLINEIHKAFVSTRRPEYSKEILGLSFGGGIAGKEVENDWEIGGAGLGSLLTPTGGAALGGGYISKDEMTFGGAAVATPIGFVKKIPLVGHLVKGKEEIGIDSLVGGYEKLDNGTKRILARAISTQWDPANPSQIMMAVNREENVEGKAFMSARYFYVDKKGTLFDVKGGTNDFVKTLNYMAGYANKQFLTPTTYAWDVQPKIKRGGGVIAFDVGKIPLLLHAQAIPFFVPKGKPQPLLIQWTAAFAYTSKTEKRTDIHRFSAPGQFLRLKTGADGSKKTDYVVQELTYMLRRVKGRRDAWELQVGGGPGWVKEKGFTGKGGAFLKVRKPTYGFGGGAFYETGSANLKAIALFEESEDSRRYIESLHRIGGTAYLSKQTTNKLVLGALAHVVGQLKKEKDAGLKPDKLFWRVVGIIKGLQSGVKFDWSRISGMDQILNDYENLAKDISKDPAQAETLINKFRDKYIKEINQVFNNYSLGIQVRRDLSLEGIFVTKEEENKWSKQVPHTAHGRILYTWRVGSWTGFWRTFASLPLAQIYGVEETSLAGVAGTGFGLDLFNGFWLQRAAVDVGVLLATVHVPGSKRWMAEGYFTQWALRVYSSILEDSRQYRALLKDYAKYKSAVRMRKFSSIPKHVRAIICKGLPELFPKEKRSAILNGKKVSLTKEEAGIIESSLWENWFFSKKFDIEQKFNGHMRAYIGWSGYFFSDKTHWDLGAFMEYTNRLNLILKTYAILSKRDVYKVIAGAEVKKERMRAGVVAGVSEKGQVGAAGSVGVNVGSASMPVEVGVSGYVRTSNVPSYAAPVYRPATYSGRPEFGVIFYVTLGEGGISTTPKP